MAQWNNFCRSENNKASAVLLDWKRIGIKIYTGCESCQLSSREIIWQHFHLSPFLLNQPNKLCRWIDFNFAAIVLRAVGILSPGWLRKRLRNRRTEDGFFLFEVELLHPPIRLRNNVVGAVLRDEPTTATLSRDCLVRFYRKLHHEAVGENCRRTPDRSLLK